MGDSTKMEMKKLAALTALTALSTLSPLAPRLAEAASTRTLLVFPFENQSPRPDLDWLSVGFAEMLASRLRDPTRYVLGRDERNRAYEELGCPPDAVLTLASEYKVAQTLGVDWAVLGSFTVEGNQLKARARLLDMRHLKLRPVLEAAGELSEVVELETRLAWRMLATEDPGFTTGNEEDFSARFREIRLDAFENYIRGILATDGEARVHFLEAADRLNPADHTAAFELGRDYFNQKDYANSAKWLRKLAASDRDYLESLFLLGVDEFFLGHEAEAEKAFASLAQQVPLGEVSNNLGVMQAHRGAYAEALPNFEQAYRADPTDSDFCFNLGICLWYLKRYDEAAQHLEEALRENDDDPAAHALLAAALGKLGNADGQRREQQWLDQHEAAPTTATAEDILPWTRVKKRYDGKAFRLLSLTVRNALEETLAKEPAAQHGGVHYGQGEAFLAAGRLPEAERELNEAASLVPQDANAHLALGQVYELESRHDEAAAELETSLRCKDTAPAHLWLARVYLALDRLDPARDQGQIALSMDPGNRYAKDLIERIREHAAQSGKGKPRP